MELTIDFGNEVPMAAPLLGEAWSSKEQVTPAQARREEMRRLQWRRLRATQGIGELEQFLGEIERIEGLSRRSIAREEICRLRLECLGSLLEEAESDFAETQRILRTHLLPLCLRPRRDIPLPLWTAIQKRQKSTLKSNALKSNSSGGSVSSRRVVDIGDYWSWREAHEARELLERWFRGCLPEQRLTARIPLMADARVALQDAVLRFDELARDSEVAFPFYQEPFDRDDSETAPLTHQCRRVQAAFATLASIGYRDETTDELFSTLMERDDAIGASALNALAVLGVPKACSGRLQPVLRRFALRRSGSHMGYAFQELADASSFDVAVSAFEQSVHETLKSAVVDEQNTHTHSFATEAAEANSSKRKGKSSPALKTHAEDSSSSRRERLSSWDIEVNASSIRVFLSRHPYESAWHDRVWNTVWTLHGVLANLTREAHATFLGNGGKFLSCNSRWMLRDILLTHIPSFGDDPGDERYAGSHFMRSLALESVEKCVQPRALRALGGIVGDEAGVINGLPVASGAQKLRTQKTQLEKVETSAQRVSKLKQFLPWLEKDVTFNTHYQNNVDNSLRRLKRQAWRLCLTLGVQPPTIWLERAFLDESSGHVRGAVCDIAAHLRWTDVPAFMLELTKEKFDAPREKPYDEFLSRMGAQRVLASAATRPAFEALLHSGFTMQGELLAATIRHLGEAAFWRYKEGDIECISDLTESAMNALGAKERELAVGALALVGQRGCVDSRLLPELLQLVQDQSLAAYSRASLVQVVGQMELHNEGREIAIRVLKEVCEIFAPSHHPPKKVRGEYELGWYAVEALVKLGGWESVYVLLLERLQLQERYEADDVLPVNALSLS